MSVQTALDNIWLRPSQRWGLRIQHELPPGVPEKTGRRGARPLALALVAPRTGEDLTWPCGACLQVALELGGPSMPVYASSVAEDAPIRESTVTDLLPNGPFVHR